jgi:hypothetical protein
MTGCWDMCSAVRTFIMMPDNVEYSNQRHVTKFTNEINPTTPLKQALAVVFHHRRRTKAAVFLSFFPSFLLSPTYILCVRPAAAGCKLLTNLHPILVVGCCRRRCRDQAAAVQVMLDGG